MSIKVLVIDDSAFMRKIISDTINKISECEVVGIARDGESSLPQIRKLKPDIITLDIEMPGMNGLETLKKIKAEFDIPVIMLSSHSGEEMTIASLEIGAMDFIEKPENLFSISSDFESELKQKLTSISATKPTKQRTPSENRQKRRIQNRNLPSSVKAIVIGASTGGPRALMRLIKYIPSSLKIPIVIVQHMPSGFTLSFSKRLNQEANVNVVEARDNMILKGGTVYIAPGDYHLRIKSGRIKLTEDEAKIHGVRPAVDYLFESASVEYGENLAAIILTGMGNDGTIGMKKIKALKGYTIAQDEETSVVFGMPRRAIESGVVDSILSLDEIGDQLNVLIEEKQWKQNS